MHILPLPEGFAPPDTVRPVGMGFMDKDCTGLGYMPEVARPVAAVGRHWLEVGGCWAYWACCPTGGTYACGCTAGCGPGCI